MAEETLDRTEQFIGRDGLERIGQVHIVVAGVGGLGTQVVQQLAFLRVGRLTFIDPGDLKESSRNRYVGSRFDDAIPGSRKVDLARRLVGSIDPRIEVRTIYDSFVSAEGFEAIAAADFVLGCLDTDGARLVLNEICSAFARRYIDLGTEIPPEDWRGFGGRVCISWDGQGCLYCFGVLDRAEAHRTLQGPDLVRDQEVLYGVRASRLCGGGPAVVTLNGVVASLGTTEFLLWASGMREPKRLLRYRGVEGKVTVGVDQPEGDCFYCKRILGRRSEADVERYLRMGAGAWVR